MNFIDLDSYIENKYGKSINSLFDDWGEDKFRLVERECLREVGPSENTLIATGGGTPCFFDNIDYMNELGDTIYLRTSVGELRERMKTLKYSRPLMREKTDKEMESHITKMLDKREQFYMRSRYILETDYLNPNNIMESLNELKDV
jgi:shikimate kinase